MGSESDELRVVRSRGKSGDGIVIGMIIYDAARAEQRVAFVQVRDRARTSSLSPHMSLDPTPRTACRGNALKSGWNRRGYANVIDVE